MTPRVRRPLGKSATPLDRLASDFLASTALGDSINDEDLADFLRDRFQLGPFPRDRELLGLLKELGIAIGPLKGGTSLHGANFFHPATGPVIRIREEINRARYETTICHELREVLENAFRRVDPCYSGTTTHDNKSMNPRSDRFAGALLMAAQDSRDLLAALGFDPIAFTVRTGRSLSSVLYRMQSLFPAGCPFPAPVAGFWLYEPPFEEMGDVGTPLQLAARHLVPLNGFSTARAKARSAAVAHVLPARLSTVANSPDALMAATSGRPICRTLPALDLFGEETYVLIVEPVLRTSRISKVLLAAVRKDGICLVEPWLSRLEVVEALKTG